MSRTCFLLAAMLLMLTACSNGDKAEVEKGVPGEAGTGSSRSADPEPYLALNTPDYKERPVSQFDADFKPYEDSYGGYGREHPHMAFMQSLFYAKMELIGAANDELPSVGFTAASGPWALHYSIYWDIADQSVTTVGERDALILGCEELVQGAFEGFAEEQLASGDALGSLQASLDTLAEGLSGSWGDVRIVAEELERDDMQ